jgi:FKBP-type peptidyl-prolyl cis-trans isomerase FklB
MAQDSASLKDQKQKVSYCIGVNLGRSWKGQEIDIDMEALTRGVNDIMKGAKTALTDEEMKEIMRLYVQEMRSRSETKRKEQAAKNAKEGETFLAENKGKEGVVSLPSGLQYKILKDGSGDSPKSNDLVTVNYRGTLIDGTEFDSSYKNNKPAKFNVSGVIKGWTEALQLMKPGAKWQLFIPPNLAYGESGSPMGGRIGPSATLIFEVELLSVEATPPPPPITSDIIKVPSQEEMNKGAKIEIIKKEDAEKAAKEAK